MRLSSDLERVHTLIFSVSTLHFLMYTLLHLALKDAGPTRLVVIRDLQDVGSVDPVVGSASHTVVTFAIELIHRDLRDGLAPIVWSGRNGQLTLLYVAEYTLSAMMGQ